MGFFSFLKKFFGSGDEKMEAELDAARARHGIKLTEKEKAAADKPTTEDERIAEDYDVWEDLKTFRSSFFIGGWLAGKLHTGDDEKVKKKLEELEKKRKEKEAGKKGEG